MMRKKLSLLAMAACLIMAPVCAFAFRIGISDVIENAKLIKDATIKPGDAEEREVGQGVAATLLGAGKLLDNRGVQDYVNKVGLWVALQSSRPSLPWRFAVLDTDAVNAFAAPGGYIFVTKGLLFNLRNEDELAGVLAHEIAHVVQQHHFKALQKDASLKLGGKAVSRAVGVGGLEGEALNLIAKGAKTLYSRGLDQEDEFEADRIGVVLAARAGYDPYGLPSVLQTLGSINPGSSGLTLLLRTHPRPADRFTRLDQQMSGRLDTLATHPPLRDRYFSALATLTGPAAGPATPATQGSTPGVAPATAPVGLPATEPTVPPTK